MVIILVFFLQKISSKIPIYNCLVENNFWNAKVNRYCIFRDTSQNTGWKYFYVEYDKKSMYIRFYKILSPKEEYIN